jgi:hypothetical protein
MRFKGFILFAVLIAAGTVLSQEPPGSVDIRSTLVGTRVYLDDAYVGDADLFLEEVLPGDHVFTLRQGSQRIRGQFRIKPGEMLMLEGRFEEDRIVDLKELAREEAAKRAEAEKKAEAERKALALAEAEKKKEPQQKIQAKPPVPAEKKKAEPKKPVVAMAKPTKSPEEEQREMHVNIIRVDINEVEGTGFEVKISPKVNTKTVINFTDSKGATGKFYRNKQNVLLCEENGCSRDWTGRFFYVDETGKRDAFLIRWKETVFTGITPSGTSKKDLDLCLNGDCKRITHPADETAPVQGGLERYVLTWSKNAFIIRRADLVKEISEAEGKIPDF